MFVVGLISSYREGRLIRGALGSLAPHVDAVYVLDAPIGEPCAGAETDPGRPPANVTVRRSDTPRLSDAAKRTEMVRWAQQRFPQRPLWGVWIDGDEMLMHGETLVDHLDWIESESQAVEEIGFKCPLRLVEYDGSVALCHGHVVRIDLIEEYLLSLALAVMPAVSPEPVPLGNECIWRPGELSEDGSELTRWPAPPTAFMRPPLIGEPHILHRSLLRPTQRALSRMHDAEEIERRRLGVGSPP